MLSALALVVGCGGEDTKKPAADPAADALQGVRFRGGATADQKAAAVPVLRLYGAKSPSECSTIVTSDVQPICFAQVPVGGEPPTEVQQVQLYGNGTCGNVTVSLSEGSKQLTVENVRGTWLVGVSDDFGDESGEPCTEDSGTAPAGASEASTLTSIDMEVYRGGYSAGEGEATFKLARPLNEIAVTDPGAAAGMFEIQADDTKYSNYRCSGSMRTTDLPARTDGFIVLQARLDGSSDAAACGKLVLIEFNPDGSRFGAYQQSKQSVLFGADLEPGE